VPASIPKFLLLSSDIYGFGASPSGLRFSEHQKL